MRARQEHLPPWKILGHKILKHLRVETQIIFSSIVFLAKDICPLVAVALRDSGKGSPQWAEEKTWKVLLKTFAGGRGLL